MWLCRGQHRRGQLIILFLGLCHGFPRYGFPPHSRLNSKKFYPLCSFPWQIKTRPWSVLQLYLMEIKLNSPNTGWIHLRQLKPFMYCSQEALSIYHTICSQQKSTNGIYSSNNSKSEVALDYILGNVLFYLRVSDNKRSFTSLSLL